MIVPSRRRKMDSEDSWTLTRSPFLRTSIVASSCRLFLRSYGPTPECQRYSLKTESSSTDHPSHSVLLHRELWSPTKSKADLFLDVDIFWPCSKSAPQKPLGLLACRTFGGGSFVIAYLPITPRIYIVIWFQRLFSCAHKFRRRGPRDLETVVFGRYVRVDGCVSRRDRDIVEWIV